MTAPTKIKANNYCFQLSPAPRISLFLPSPSYSISCFLTLVSLSLSSSICLPYHRLSSFLCPLLRLFPLISIFCSLCFSIPVHHLFLPSLVLFSCSPAPRSFLGSHALHVTFVPFALLTSLSRGFLGLTSLPYHRLSSFHALVTGISIIDSPVWSRCILPHSVSVSVCCPPCVGVPVMFIIGRTIVAIVVHARYRAVECYRDVSMLLACGASLS